MVKDRKKEQRIRMSKRGFKRFEDYVHPVDFPVMHKKASKLRKKHDKAIDTVSGHAQGISKAKGDKPCTRIQKPSALQR